MVIGPRPNRAPKDRQAHVPFQAQRNQVSSTPEIPDNPEVNSELTRLQELLPNARDLGKRTQHDLTMLLELFSRLESGVDRNSSEGFLLKRQYRRQREALYQAIMHMKSFGKWF